MKVLGIESSCDETGVAIFDTEKGLLSHALYSQIALHAQYGGVVPELASRDHINRIVSLVKQAFVQANIDAQELDAVAYTQGPGLAGALLVGASVASSFAYALSLPLIPVHHLEGHLLSPLLSKDAPQFPFVSLLVSGGHTQLMRVDDIGSYTLLGETVDDAAGEAFDKSAKLLGLAYPGGAALSQLAQQGQKTALKLPRPMLHSKDLNFSFSGLKTAVLTQVNQMGDLTVNDKQNIAYAFVDAIVDVLTSKCERALRQCDLQRLVVAGGVGANTQLRDALTKMAYKNHARVYFPPLEFCTDNGAMIAFVGAMRFKRGLYQNPFDYSFTVKPRWPLEELSQIV